MLRKQQPGGARPDGACAYPAGGADPRGDPQLLLALARDQSTAGRRSLAFSMVDLFGAGGGLSQHSRDLAAQILDRLIRSFETELRHALAERLAGKPDVPRALILLLANDAIEVARPVLLESEVLRPEDLIAIIENRSVDHQLVIAMRRNLTEAVCVALVETDNVAVIEALLKNRSASIPQITLDYLVEEAHWVEAYREPLVQRQELRPPLARRLYALVSAALRAHILEHFDIDPETLDDELEPLVTARTGAARGAERAAATRTGAQSGAADSGGILAEAEALAAGTADVQVAGAAAGVTADRASARRVPEHHGVAPDGGAAAQRAAATQADAATAGAPNADGPKPDKAGEDSVTSDAADRPETTPQVLIALLRRGDRGRFEQRFATLSGLRSPRLERVLYSADGKELAVACRALGIDKKTFAVIVFLCRQDGPKGRPVDDPRAVAQVIDYFDQMEPAAALARLRRWRRNPDYVAAIEDLELHNEAREEPRDDL